jgi:hypothetical protein
MASRNQAANISQKACDARNGGIAAVVKPTSGSFMSGIEKGIPAYSQAPTNAKIAVRTKIRALGARMILFLPEDGAEQGLARPDYGSMTLRLSAGDNSHGGLDLLQVVERTWGGRTDHRSGVRE